MNNDQTFSLNTSISADPTGAPVNALADCRTRRVFLRGLRLDARIGAYESEMHSSQPVVIDIEVDVRDPEEPLSDNLEDVVCYNKLTQGVRDIIVAGHIQLVETLAERIASMCLVNPMALAVKVSVSKPSAIPEAVAAGVEIYRIRSV